MHVCVCMCTYVPHACGNQSATFKTPACLIRKSFVEQWLGACVYIQFLELAWWVVLPLGFVFMFFGSIWIIHDGNEIHMKKI